MCDCRIALLPLKVIVSPTKNSAVANTFPERLPARKVVVIDQAYIETNTPFIRKRLVKAGAGSGNLLNQALGTEQPEALDL
jgi:hypothetical protein